MGPHDSTPFGKGHMEICVISDDNVRDMNNDVDSEGAWSDLDEEGGGAPLTSAHHTQPSDSLVNQGSRRTSIVLQRGHSAGAVPLKRLVRASELAAQHASLSSGAKTARSHREKDPSASGKLQENTLLRNMLQEELSQRMEVSTPVRLHLAWILWRAWIGSMCRRDRCWRIRLSS